MKNQIVLSQQWILYGSISGILSTLFFIILLLVNLSSSLQIIFSCVFGILFSLTGIGIHHCMKYYKQSIHTQIGAVLIFIAGILFSLMLSIQLTFKGYINKYLLQATLEEKNILSWIEKTVNPIHLGIQITTDFCVAIAMISIALSMFNHKLFGRAWGITGVTIAITLLIIKCYSFPFTPDEVGIPYIIGPLISIWFLSVCIQCLLKRKRITE